MPGIMNNQFMVPGTLFGSCNPLGVLHVWGHAIPWGAVKSISQAAYCVISGLADILLPLFILLYSSYRNT